MVASKRTISQVRAVILRHLDQATAERLLADLRQVPGNSSFVETVRLLEQALRSDDDAVRVPPPFKRADGWTEYDVEARLQHAERNQRLTRLASRFTDVRWALEDAGVPDHHLETLDDLIQRLAEATDA
jgi:hypothetical protein